MNMGIATGMSNQAYTQYIPLSVHELKAWAGTPTIFVLDCSAAGVLLNHFIQPLVQPEDRDGVDPDTPPGEGSVGMGVASGAVQSDMSECCNALLMMKYDPLFGGACRQSALQRLNGVVNDLVIRALFGRQLRIEKYVVLERDAGSVEFFGREKSRLAVAVFNLPTALPLPPPRRSFLRIVPQSVCGPFFCWRPVPGCVALQR